jgi:hypothetical protein
VWVNVDAANFVARQDQLAVAGTQPLYGETMALAAAYPTLGNDVDVAPTFGVALSGQLGVGVRLDMQNYTMHSGLAISVPSPYFFNTVATDAEPTSDTVSRKDRAIDLNVVYTPPTPSAVRLRLFAGPTVFHVNNQMVDTIRYNQAAGTFLPVNVVAITSYTTKEVSATGIGFNAGADLGYFFSRHFGVGGAVSFNHGTLTITDPLTVQNVDLTAGHVSAGGGLRMRF